MTFNSRRIGLLAGWGPYPVLVAEALRRQGYSTYCLGLKDNADPALAEICDQFEWLGLAKMGRAIRYFHRHDCRDVTMAGKIHKVELFRPWVWLKHLPDWRAIRCYYPHFVLTRKDRRDDTLLSAAVSEFAKEGIALAPATDFAPELLVPAGQWSRRGPTSAEWRDIAFGWQLAKEMGRLDVGQSVAIRSRSALAVEAIEGTDECIRRAGELCASGGFTLVKVAKPQQDMRFDVPTIGLKTVEALRAARGRVLAVEAGRTILLERQKVIEFADRHGLVLVAVEPTDPRLEFTPENRCASRER